MDRLRIAESPNRRITEPSTDRGKFPRSRDRASPRSPLSRFALISKPSRAPFTPGELSRGEDPPALQPRETRGDQHSAVYAKEFYALSHFLFFSFLFDPFVYKYRLLAHYRRIYEPPRLGPPITTEKI